MISCVVLPMEISEESESSVPSASSESEWEEEQVGSFFLFLEQIDQTQMFGVSEILKADGAGN